MPCRERVGRCRKMGGAEPLGPDPERTNRGTLADQSSQVTTGTERRWALAQRRASFRRPLLGPRTRSSRGYRPAGFRRSLLRPALVVALIAFVAFDVLLVLRLTRSDPITPAGKVPAGAVRDDASPDGSSDATRGDGLEIGTIPFPDVPAAKPTSSAGSGSTSTGSTSTSSGGSTTDSGGSGSTGTGDSTTDSGGSGSTGTGSDSSGGSGSGGGGSDDGGSGDDSVVGGPGGGG